MGVRVGGWVKRARLYSVVFFTNKICILGNNYCVGHFVFYWDSIIMNKSNFLVYCNVQFLVTSLFAVIYLQFIYLFR